MQTSKRGTPDFLLLTLTIVLIGFGVLMVFSAGSPLAALKYHDATYFGKRQLIWAVLGISGMFVLMNVHYLKWKRWFAPFFFIIIIMLFYVLTRDPINGARSWLSFGSVGIQPSEFMKLAVILYLAALIDKKGEKFRDFHKGLFPVMVIVGFVAGLIMLQPDFGTMMIFVMIAFIVIVCGGANLKHLFYSMSLIVICAAAFINIYLLAVQKHGYRMQRITTYLNPWDDPQGSGYNIIQSLYAFGNGGVYGAGFGESIQKLYYLPAAHTDFIFAIVGEELGLIGSSIFLLIYIALLWRGVIVSLRCPDMFGTIIGIGIVGMIAIQALINIGGVTNTIPLTGVTLPFISYGGSSLLVCAFSMGILLSISRENNRTEIQKT